jgi:hypothetical protein
VRHTPKNAANKKPRGLPGTGVHFLPKTIDPGHPVRARSSLRSERSEERSRLPNSAHAPRSLHRSEREGTASCRDRMSMGSTLNFDSNNRVIQYVSASRRKSISFSTDFAVHRFILAVTAPASAT